MEEQRQRWADYDSDDTDEVSVHEERTFGPTHGHAFREPLFVRGVRIGNVTDFVNHSHMIEQVFLELTNNDDMGWALMLEDIGPDSTPGNIESALRDLRYYLDTDLDTTKAVTTGLDLEFPMPEEPLPVEVDEVDMSNVTARMELLRGFDLSDIGHNPERHVVDYPKIKDSDVCFIRSSMAFKGPPLKPVIPPGFPVLLRLSRVTEESPDRLDYRDPWDETFASVLGTSAPHPVSQLDYYESDAWTESMSNRRRRADPPIKLIFPDGGEVNIGMHGYWNRQDVDIPLCFEDCDMALQEFFAAPGGEGLGTATPSHLLHQVIAAIYSHAIRNHTCTVEYRSRDLSIADVYLSQTERVDIVIDITSSASLHQKALRPQNIQSERPHQGAVTKYDMAAALIPCAPAPVSQLLTKLVACCLACEFPEHWLASPETMTPDLMVQYHIYDTIAGFSQKNIELLGGMCYEAAISECIDFARINGHEAQGIPYTEKRDILVNRLDSLEPRTNIAFPPIPISEICPFPSEHAVVFISGHAFDITPRIPGESGFFRHTMDSRHEWQDFLQDFPASGIVSFTHAKEIASIIDRQPLIVNGLTHMGPASDATSTVQPLVQQCNELYSSSANAQFLEIRSDLVRSIHRFPFPPQFSWNQVWLYKNKVCAWYSCRDAPNSPEGFRVDWFALSGFRVAGSIPVTLSDGTVAYLWPRQRLRSQEMDLAHMAPRRFKSVLFSMLEKCRVSRSNFDEIRMAWERMLITTNSSTWASGQTFLTSRYLSASLASPASPFHTMADKFTAPVTFADVFYHMRMRRVLVEWSTRDQYHNRSPILGLPRHMSQLESYWKEWVPNQFADTTKHMADCARDLWSEHQLLEDTRPERLADLKSQLRLLSRETITIDDLRQSIKSSCSIDTDGKFGWSFVGSMAAGYALNKRSPLNDWDRKHARGRIARRLVNHLTVRHSARVDSSGYMHRGTVAEMIIESGFDKYMSKVDQTYRFLFGHPPIFMNHPKKGEHKDREISITDPDSRIMLSDAEHIAGSYGATTGVDYLKVNDKDARFYQKAERILTRGGVAQSSDAKRYGPMMSNMAIAIMCLYMGAKSMHMKWCSLIYARLAFRRMLLPLSIVPKLEHRISDGDYDGSSTQTLIWLRTLPVICTDGDTEYVSYCDAHHMGQGMSHHGSSLLHAGGLLVTHAAVDKISISIDGIPFNFRHNIMVTSDDSTTMPEPYPVNPETYVTRRHRQTAGHMFLALFRQARKIGLRSVSVSANLPKEVVAGDRVEFNSNDSGIGSSCPILGFRELICLMVPPTSPSLIGDYLDAHANARTIALSGQGLVTGSFFHALKIDAIEERWKITAEIRNDLLGLDILPKMLLTQSGESNLCSSPTAWMPLSIRAFMLQINVDHNAAKEDIDPHVADSVFGPMLHVRVSMARQHRLAISAIKHRIETLKSEDSFHAAYMLESSLKSTLASARSRNLGRIATRIRHRTVRPRPYYIADQIHEFAKAPILEMTMTWLSFLNNMHYNMMVRPDILDQAVNMSGRVQINRVGMFHFPDPPRRRRFKRPIVAKPLYIKGPYGETPFGRHAIERSSAIVFDGDGHEERVSMQKYYAMRNYRAFIEHVVYGSSFVVNWIHKKSAKLSVTTVPLPESENVRRTVRFGSYDHDSIKFLIEMQARYPEKIVLSLHKALDSFGVFHAVHKGIPYTISREMVLEERTLTAHTDSFDNRFLLAVQGLSEVPTWSGSAPSRDDVMRYVNGGTGYQMSPTMASLERENVQRDRVTCPTYSAEIEYNGELTLVHTSPSVLNFHDNIEQHRPNIPYMRSRVIAELALGGYWFSNVRGVEFRAGLRGHWYRNTTWTGATIGWHASATNEPNYIQPHFSIKGLRGILMINGLETGNELSQLDISIDSVGFRLVSESSTRNYAAAYKLNPSHAPLFLAANAGSRHPIPQESTGILTVPYVATPGFPHISPEEAKAQLVRVLSGELAWNTGF